VKGLIEFSRVTFAYDGENPVIRDLSVRVLPGETLAIVGATGAGKTTVINLLERFYDPGQGEIRLDGIDLRLLDVEWLRRQIGLVMQDVFIIPGTIRENIVLDRTVSREDLERLVELSQLAKLVKGLPDGLETRIGEGAMDLSAGQQHGIVAFLPGSGIGGRFRLGKIEVRIFDGEVHGGLQYFAGGSTNNSPNNSTSSR
jgi:ATP-binding cassette subfamily B protein